jgi:glycosyltransferase involved in cell wall biosynthesis
MNAAGQTVCLNMIVKNEAPVIRRCLDSVRPIIDHWVIVDTGSTDGTQDVIREHMKDLPGELHERPWRDFAYNRSEALTLARPHGDYSLIIDADDALNIPGEFELLELTDDSYTFEILHGPIRHRRTQLVRNMLPWRWEGVLHEYLTCEGAETGGHLPIHILIHHDGARRRDPETYHKDAAMLERALEDEANPFLIARYTFYLAQSYRNCGEKDKALNTYLRRAELGYWDQEVFWSYYQAAQLKSELAYDHEEIIATYLSATDACPFRAEALHSASRLCRYLGDNKRGYDIGKRAIDLAAPIDGLFVERWIYDYGALDEFAVNAYWTGHYRECMDAALRALERGTVPDDQHKRFVNNVQFAVANLPKEDARTEWVEAAVDDGAHDIKPARNLHTGLSDPPPRVLIAILAKQKEPMLEPYLECIEALDYPKSRIVLYIRTNNNKDSTREILRVWAGRVAGLYAHIETDDRDVPEKVEDFEVHEWNATRFKVLAKIRNISLRKTLEHNCDYYFVSDVDNFLRPCTLRELLALKLPIVSPLLRSVSPNVMYSNYHADIDDSGYYRASGQYTEILYRQLKGIIEVPVVHCTYAIRADVIAKLDYEDGTERHEYVVFSHSARRSGIPQYIDNRQVYGYLTLDHDPQMASEARRLLSAELPSPRIIDPRTAQARLAAISTRAAHLREQGSEDTDEELAFIEFCRRLNEISSSQLFQDAWVLFELDQKRGGYFVEFGACDGIYLSNTVCLERYYDWQGALAEPSPCWRESLLKNRSGYVSTKCISGSSGQIVEFHEAVNSPALSTMDEFVDSDMNAWARKVAKTIQRETLSLMGFLEEARAPRNIDYLSIDTEGSEFDVLANFDFRQYDIKLITVEHNFTPRREMLYALMGRNGYRRRFPSVSGVDDWYVRV